MMKGYLFLLLVLSMMSAAQKCMIIGHRGACGHAPENTLRSFEKAIELGVDMVEFDVHQCKSGELVVIHDRKVDRTTNGSGYVAEKTLAELQQLDAGQGQQIPTLQQVLDLIDRRVKVYVELKTAHVVDQLAQIICEYVTHKGWQYDDFLVASFNHYEALFFKLKCPEVKVGAILYGLPINNAEFADHLGAHAVVMGIDFINPVFVDDAHQRSKKIFVYTANDHDDIEHIHALGVDGIISDYPDRVFTVLNQKAS